MLIANIFYYVFKKQQNRLIFCSCQSSLSKVKNFGHKLCFSCQFQESWITQENSIASDGYKESIVVILRNLSLYSNCQKCWAGQVSLQLSTVKSSLPTSKYYYRGVILITYHKHSHHCHLNSLHHHHISRFEEYSVHYHMQTGILHILLSHLQ